jgi:hypothetical protein
VSLVGLLGLADPAGGVALQTGPFAHRPEHARTAGGHDDQRRRVRRRLVRRRRGPWRLPRRRAGLERPQPPGAGRPRRLTAVRGPHPRLDRHGRPADQLPPVPLRTLAVGPQRPHPRLPPGQAGPGAGGGPVALPRDRGIRGLRGDVSSWHSASASSATRPPRWSRWSASSRPRPATTTSRTRSR